MKSKRNLEVMQEVLCKDFEEYILNLNEDEFYDFLTVVESNGVLGQLSRENSVVEWPEEIFTCSQCRNVYGDCEKEMAKAKDMTMVCRRRFRSYAETPAKK